MLEERREREGEISGKRRERGKGGKVGESGYCIFVHRCNQLVTAYLEDTNPEARLLVGGDMRKIQLCFALLKVHSLIPQLSSPSSSLSTRIESLHTLVLPHHNPLAHFLMETQGKT